MGGGGNTAHASGGQLLSIFGHAFVEGKNKTVARRLYWKIYCCFGHIKFFLNVGTIFKLLRMGGVKRVMVYGTAKHYRETRGVTNWGRSGRLGCVRTKKLNQSHKWTNLEKSRFQAKSDGAPHENSTEKHESHSLGRLEGKSLQTIHWSQFYSSF